MGVPKFYRWLSERYPLLSQVVKEHQIPEFDNLYLDMNGIVHVCSHPNDDDPHFRITEEKIYEAIFHYIEFLFRIIKPRKVFFMAIDGVAPRAKMNQQRGRRFRSAHDAKMLEEEAKNKGEKLPDEARFDSNCITPGTPFMVKLQQQLKYFVSKKISTDRIWKNVRVILSGHEVPGEGEHKVMDFIRYEKSQPGYNPNTRHCLYGLDADLIMLGIASHEPHFSLLREEVVFGKKAQHRSTTAEETTFHLLHLSLLREYLAFEFDAAKSVMTFEYDLERIIDDWILMGFLVGNDFIPHLPFMHINEDALPALWSIYCGCIKQMSGYLHKNGTIDMANFEIFLKEMSEWQYEKFEEKQEDDDWFEAKKSMTGFQSKRVQDKKRKKRGRGREVETFSEEEDDMATSLGFGEDMSSLSVVSSSLSATASTTTASSTRTGSTSTSYITATQGSTSTGASAVVDDGEGSDALSGDEHQAPDPQAASKALFEKKRLEYYNKKLFDSDEPVITSEQVREMCHHYIRGIQWILLYYYTGVPSWGWYFPYHYAPFLEDIVTYGITDVDVTLELGTPFLPFQQLLAVLPSLSRTLLPEAYQYLMTSKESQIIEFYPENFKTDLNGKSQEWEAVVLIPFIDEERLLSAMDTRGHLLTPDERERNCHGKCFAYANDKSLSFLYQNPQLLMEPIKHCTAKESTMPADCFRMDPEKLVTGLCPGVLLDVVSPGFPTLKHIQHRQHLNKAGVRVFQNCSRSFNMIVSLLIDDDVEDGETGPSVARIAAEVLDKTVFVHYPFLVEAKVVAVFTDEESCVEMVDGKPKVLPQTGEGQSRFLREVEHLTTEYSERKGLEISTTDIILHVNICEGERYACDAKTGQVRLQKEWSPHLTPICYQTIVTDVPTLRQARAAAALNRLDETDSGLAQVAGGAAAAPSASADAVAATEVDADGEELPTLNELFPVDGRCFLLTGRYYGAMGKVESVELKQSPRVHIQAEQYDEPHLLKLVKCHQERADRYKPLPLVAREVGITTSLLSRLISSIQVERVRSGTSISKFDIGLQLKSTNKGTELVGFARGYQDDNKKWRTWELSPMAVKTIKEYVKKFPSLFKRLDRISRNDSFTEKDVFGENDSSMQVEVTAFLRQTACAGAEQVQCGSCVLDHGHIAEIEEAVEESKASGKSKKRKVLKMQVRPHCLFMPPEYFNKLRPDANAQFYLWDRVVNVRSSGAVPLGMRGTVIGIYQPLGAVKEEEHELVYEVLFDEEFHRGLQLRSSGKTCYRVMAASLINISHGQRVFSNSKQATSASAATDETVRSALAAVDATAARRAALKTPQGFDQPSTPQRRGPAPHQALYSQTVSHSAFTGHSPAATAGKPGQFTTPVAVREQARSAASAPAVVQTGADPRQQPSAENFGSPLLAANGKNYSRGRGKSPIRAAAPAPGTIRAPTGPGSASARPMLAMFASSAAAASAKSTPALTSTPTFTSVMSSSSSTSNAMTRTTTPGLAMVSSPSVSALMMSSSATSNSANDLDSVSMSLKSMLNISSPPTASALPTSSAASTADVPAMSAAHGNSRQSNRGQPAGPTASALLRQHCAARQLGVPRYEVTFVHSQYTAQAIVGSLSYRGAGAKTNAEAVEAAASGALCALTSSSASVSSSPGATSAASSAAAASAAAAAIMQSITPASARTTTSSASATPAPLPSVPPLLQQLNQAAMQAPSGKLGDADAVGGGPMLAAAAPGPGSSPVSGIESPWQDGPFKMLFSPSPQTAQMQPAPYGHSPAQQMQRRSSGPIPSMPFAAPAPYGQVNFMGQPSPQAQAQAHSSQHPHGIPPPNFMPYGMPMIHGQPGMGHHPPRQGQHPPGPGQHYHQLPQHHPPGPSHAPGLGGQGHIPHSPGHPPFMPGPMGQGLITPGSLMDSAPLQQATASQVPRGVAQHSPGVMPGVIHLPNMSPAVSQHTPPANVAHTPPSFVPYQVMKRSKPQPGKNT